MDLGMRATGYTAVDRAMELRQTPMARSTQCVLSNFTQVTIFSLCLQGEWYQNKRHGHGRKTRPSGDSYEVTAGYLLASSLRVKVNSRGSEARIHSCRVGGTPISETERARRFGRMGRGMRETGSGVNDRELGQSRTLTGTHTKYAPRISMAVFAQPLTSCCSGFRQGRMV